MVAPLDDDARRIKLQKDLLALAERVDDFKQEIIGYSNEAGKISVTCYQPNYDPPKLTSCNSVFPGSSGQVTWQDQLPVVGRQYQIRINGAIVANNIDAPATSVTVSGIPTDGSVLQKEIYYRDPGSAPIWILADSCECTAFLATNGIHECMGFNLISRLNEFQKPSFLRNPTATFTSLAAYKSAITSMNNHNGAVLALMGQHAGRIDVPPGITNLTLYTPPGNPAVIDATGQAFGFRTWTTSPGQNTNVEILNFETFGSASHGVFAGSDANGEYAPRGLYLGNLHVRDCGLASGAGITIRNALTGAKITVECPKVRRIGMNATGFQGRSEAIYVGRGNNPAYFSSNIDIRGADLRELNGEALDLKRNSSDILFEDFVIDDVTVPSQGAIVVLLDSPSAGSYDGNVIIRRGCISRVKTRPGRPDGNFAVIANGSTIFEDVVAWDCVNHGVDVYNDCDGPDKQVIIRNSIFWDYVGQPIRENVNTGNSTPNNPCAITRLNNIVQSNPAPNECLVSESYFKGPLTTRDGFNPA